MEPIRYTEEVLKKRRVAYKKHYVESQKAKNIHLIRVTFSDGAYQDIYKKRCHACAPMTKICVAAVRLAVKEQYLADRQAPLGKRVIDLPLTAEDYQQVKELAVRSHMSVRAYCRAVIPVMMRKEGLNGTYRDDKNDHE